MHCHSLSSLLLVICGTLVASIYSFPTVASPLSLSARDGSIVFQSPPAASTVFTCTTVTVQWAASPDLATAQFTVDLVASPTNAVPVNRTIASDVIGAARETGWLVNVPAGNYTLHGVHGADFAGEIEDCTFTVEQGSDTSCLDQSDILPPSEAAGTANTDSAGPSSSSQGAAASAAGGNAATPTAEADEGSQVTVRLSGGAIAGIVVAGFGGLALLGGLLVLALRMRRRPSTAPGFNGTTSHDTSSSLRGLMRSPTPQLLSRAMTPRPMTMDASDLDPEKLQKVLNGLR